VSDPFPLRADIERRSIAVHFALEALPPVLGDPVQIQQGVLNLVVNACEAIAAAEDGPRANLIETSLPDPRHLAIAVRDSGIGVKETEPERIFEHFVTSKRQGLGMGLAISRSIVQAHGGHIWATANEDLGLTLHVELPVRVEAEAQANALGAVRGEAVPSSAGGVGAARLRMRPRRRGVRALDG
jgi:signal transduction histidine kinase